MCAIIIENEDIIRKSALSGGVEGIVAELRIPQQDTDEPIPESNNSFHQSGNLDERLIKEVMRREPLYNFRLPLAQRGRKQAKQMWQDISIELNGNALYYVLYFCNQFIFEMDIYKSYISGEISADGREALEITTRHLHEDYC